MKSISGQYANANPFDITDEVGILLFAEYPTTFVLIDDEGEPIIRKWVDCSSDGQVDRFYYFKTNKNNLNLFINGNISHRTFVRIAEGELYYFEDVSNNEVIAKVLFIGDFPYEYYPGHVTISSEHVVDLDEIESRFNLNQQDLFQEEVKGLANQYNTETYNLHLKEGRGVGFGIARTQLLANCLLNFDVLHQEASLDYLRGRNRGEISKRKRLDLEPLISTQVYRNLAASYSVLLKPQSTQYVVGDAESATSSGLVSNILFRLLNTSLDSDILKDRIGEYSPRLVDAFRDFVSAIKDNNVNMNLSWYNPDSGIEHSENITQEKASIIVGNIEQLSAVTEEPLTKTGKFDLLNCSTGHFGFLANGESTTGYFSDNIREGIRLVNFIDTYTVSIIKKITRIAGKREPKIEHALTAYYKEATINTQ
jgi:hypothetical protein